MEQNGTIIIHQGTQEKLKDEEVVQLQAEARALELKASKKAAELERAKEELVLLAELQTMNDIIVKRKEEEKNENQCGLKISVESLITLRQLEDALKVENRQSSELKEASKFISQQMEKVEKALDEASAKLALIKRGTGWDVAQKNITIANSKASEYKERKTSFMAREKHLKLLKDTSERLTKQIEQLEAQIAERKPIEEQISDAEAELQKVNTEYDALNAKVTSHERLMKKKERMLEKPKDVNPKTIRVMDDSKRSLHTFLHKLRETSASNTKSIISMEMHLRQLESRLEVANLFLKQVFAEIQNDEPMTGISPNATEVPLIQFEELNRELELSRQTIKERDEQLDIYDTKVEELEKKMIVIRNAITSRVVSSDLLNRQKERTFGSLMNNADCLSHDFDKEFQRLTKENETLRTQLSALQY